MIEVILIKGIIYIFECMINMRYGLRDIKKVNNLF